MTNFPQQPSFPSCGLETITHHENIEQRLTQLWEEILNIHPISLTDDFFDLGGDSIDAVQLFAKIENIFHQKLPLNTLFKSGTIAALTKLLTPQKIVPQSPSNYTAKSSQQSENITFSSTETTDNWSPLVEIKSSGSQAPLFLIHPLGGETLCYHHLAKKLDIDQPIYALQPQGLDGKSTPHTTVEEMANYYLQAIRTVQPQGPYFLGGYSFGGVVAFEMAQQLQKQGEAVAQLILIDTCRPNYIQRIPLLARIPLYVQRYLLNPSKIFPEIHRIWRQYSQKQKYQHLLNATPHIADVTKDLDAEDLHVKVAEANALAFSNYDYLTYDGSLTLLRTEDKNRSQALGMKYDSLFGWGEVVTGEIDLDYIPGSHLSLLQEPNVQVVAEKLQICLQKHH
ncbi:thioesterase domain-containing protein [Calothrix sp. 336/3]|uniref:thioesterase domain-containing protein n=1 Tax=Calothrix sp. 336/3 TaxID=1337936 RepID=UPI00069B139D|nr:alpha/beta fold hydrolase [Calothrix sp. 336/3]